VEQISIEKFRKVCSTSTSIKEVIEELGGKDNGKWRILVKGISKKYNIGLPKYSSIKWEKIEKRCPICHDIFTTLKGHKREKATCSYSCSNTYFRSGEQNGNYKDSPATYRKTCIKKHGDACLLCGFNDIIEAHHIDGNRKNNKHNNLVPLCPNHHRLIHSKEHKTEIIRQLKKRLNGDVV
jgi:hypothetical protein